MNNVTNHGPGSRRARSRRGHLTLGLALLSLLAWVATLPTALAQPGKNGAATVLAGSTALVNEYTTLTSDAAAGNTSLSVADNGLNANGRFAAPLGPGDLVLLIQMQGASINPTTGSTAYGTIVSYNGAGLYELKEVAGVSGANTITFNCGLNNPYSAAGKTQVVRLPRYSSLTLNPNATLTAAAWNGQSGGVLAVEVQGNVSLAAGARFNTDGLGFRGGARNNNSALPSSFNNPGFTFTNPQLGAEKGEGIAGSQADYDNLGGRYGRGAPANGGGGGNTINASGGGGANAGRVSAYTGTGNPDPSFAAAWNLESAGFATSTSSGGGRGGYSWSENQQDATTTAPGNAAWGGDSRRDVGGLGGRPLDRSGGRLFLGGGGGAGDENDNNATAGGNGGGLVYLLAGGNVTCANPTNSGFSAAGLAGANTPSPTINGDGLGGGGGGGTVVLNVGGTVSSGLLSVAGGAGATQNINNANGTEGEGPGGGGGGGYAAYTVLSGTSLNLGGGAGGTTNSPGILNFPPNGATAGGGGTGAVISPTIAACYVLNGTVFEDVNYGGGVGRPAGTAGTSPRPGATIELYASLGSGGALLATTTTNSSGQYNFSVSPSTSYVVRVVSGTVSSSRPGYVAGLLPVQTFNGTTDRVGGEAPERPDAGPNTSSATLPALSAGTQVAQCVAPAASGPGGLTAGPDFGFNFDVVTNANDAGPGSVRQFLTNAAALGNEAGLAQSGSRTTSTGAAQPLPAGQETSIFMVPGPSAVPGLRAGLASGLTGGVVVVGLGSTLTLAGVNAANTILDGSTQTFNGGDTNAGAATNATATTVGVDALALPAVLKPEVELSFGSGTVLDIEAPSATVRGLALHGGSATDQTLLVGNSAPAGGYLLETLLVGTTPGGLRPTTIPSNGVGVYLASLSGTGTVCLSLIGFNGASGVGVHNSPSASGPNQYVSNFFVKNGFTIAGGDGITFGDNNQPSGPANVVGNLFRSQNSSGLQFEIGATGLATVVNNSILNSGLVGDPGATVPNLEGAGIVYLSRTGNERGSQADVISRNVIASSNSAGIVIGWGQQNVTISRNSTFSNATLGIDLTGTNQNVTNGTLYGDGDGVTINDGNDPATAPADLANRGVDFPVLTTATVTGSNLVINGFSRPGAEIELFIRDNDATGFGEGQTYLGTGIEGGAGDLGSGTSSYGPAPVNGLNQGTDGAASRFTFILPWSTLTAAQQSALLTTGLTATATLNASTSEFSGRVIVTNGPLPVQLTAFTATAVGATARLSWTTASEVNNDRFEVERSLDGGASFGKIGQVQGQGTKITPTDYVLTDADAAARAQSQALARPVYYRLRQVNQGGTATYSPVRSLSFGAEAAAAPRLRVYPNPATDATPLTLDLSGLPAGTYQATLYDAAGRTVRTVSAQGALAQPLDVRSLPTGLYLLRLSGTTGTGQKLELSQRVSKE